MTSAPGPWLFLAALSFSFSVGCRLGGVGGLRDDPPPDPIPGCTPNPCVESNRTQCTPASPAPRCDCDPGYTPQGDACVALPSSTCIPNPCVEPHRTVCAPTTPAATCTCDPGYTPQGASCVAVVSCTPNPCVEAHRTQCTAASPVPRCGCDPGYYLQGDTCAPAGTGLCGANDGQLFGAASPWNTPVDTAPLDAESGAIIAWLAAHHTDTLRFQISFDFNILYADASTLHRPFAPTGDYFDPDCDPAPPPVPAVGRLEGEVDYACTHDGDCHLTVIDVPECRLYEMWRTNITGGTATGTFNGGCLAIWDLSTVPPPTLRGDQCTSADGAGLPILPMMFSPDEVYAGHIDHAIRFVLPNSLIRRLVYVRPGTHSTGSTSGAAQAPPYSARLRLKAATDLSSLSTGARVIAQALQRYGMILADGGRVTWNATTDALTTHTWAEVGVDELALTGLSWNDFEVVELGTRYTWTGDCNRTPVVQ